VAVSVQEFSPASRGVDTVPFSVWLTVNVLDEAALGNMIYIVRLPYSAALAAGIVTVNVRVELRELTPLFAE
jgi:hypothetical protein